MKKKIYITLVFVLLFSSIINSQKRTPTPGSVPPPPPGLPIDGGIVFLLVSGLVYGISKLKE